MASHYYAVFDVEERPMRFSLVSIMLSFLIGAWPAKMPGWIDLGAGGFAERMLTLCQWTRRIATAGNSVSEDFYGSFVSLPQNALARRRPTNPDTEVPMPAGTYVHYSLESFRRQNNSSTPHRASVPKSSHAQRCS